MPGGPDDADSSIGIRKSPEEVRDVVETGGQAERRETKAKPTRQKGSGQGGSRQRGDSRGPGGNDGKPPQESRRRRHNEQRYAGFGDGIERAFCTRAERIMPAEFPVTSHAGTATIPRVVVARREGAVLLCTYSHCGEHVWPDGEPVSESQS